MATKFRSFEAELQWAPVPATEAENRLLLLSAEEDCLFGEYLLKGITEVDHETVSFEWRNLDDNLESKCQTEQLKPTEICAFSQPTMQETSFYKSDSTTILASTKGAKKGSVDLLCLPLFIQRELRNGSGTGKFSLPELLVLLFLAFHYLRDHRAYSKIRLSMGNKRTRSSIRRKLEKMVCREMGDRLRKGGLLHNPHLNEDTKEVILRRFWRLLQKMEALENRTDRNFAQQMRQYAVSIDVPTSR